MKLVHGLALALALLVTGAANARQSRVHEDTDFGYRIKPPKEWSQVPLQIEERWQTAKFLSDRSHFYTEPGGGWTYEHKPELVVIAFPSEATRKKAEVEKKKDEDPSKGSIYLIRNPYKDYLDYLKGTRRGGGYYVSDEKTTEVAGHSVTCYEIKVEKLSYGGPKRIVTWVHHTPEVDFAVHVEVLESAYDKLKKEIGDAQRSFALIPRTTGGLAAGDTAGRVTLIEDEASLTPEARKERRIALQKKAHYKATEALPDGWTSFKVGRFLVLCHTDEKYARRVGEQAEAVMKWLDETFAFVGPKEYVREPVLRICKDRNEESAFWRGGEGFFFGTAAAEIVTSNDDLGFTTGWAVERVNRSVLQLWFQERDRELWMAMPDWLSTGLSTTIGNARADKGKLEFRRDDWDRDRVRQRVRDGQVTKPRDLMRMTSEDFMGNSFDSIFGRMGEAGEFVRYLVGGAGAKSSRSKDLVRTYLQNLRLVVTEVAAAEKAAEKEATKKPTTEEEEEAYFREVSQKWRKKERTLIDDVWDRTFRTWSDGDWKALESAYFESL